MANTIRNTVSHVVVYARHSKTTHLFIQCQQHLATQTSIPLRHLLELSVTALVQRSADFAPVLVQLPVDLAQLNCFEPYTQQQATGALGSLVRCQYKHTIPTEEPFVMQCDAHFGAHLTNAIQILQVQPGKGMLTIDWGPKPPTNWCNKSAQIGEMANDTDTGGGKT